MFVDGAFKCCPKFFFQLYDVLKEIFPDAQLKIQSVGLSNEYTNAENTTTTKSAPPPKRNKKQIVVKGMEKSQCCW